MAPRRPVQCRDLLDRQHGVIARWQAAQIGLDLPVIDNALRRGRWQPIYWGVYAAFTGELPRMAVLWAAVLRAGPGAVLSHHTAAELDALADEQSWVIHVTVGVEREIAGCGRPSIEGLPRLVVHRSAGLDGARHPSRTPPRTRTEETVIDLTQTARTLEEAMSWFTRACSRRLTTPGRLLAAMDARPRLRWRADLTAGLADVGEGIHSILEWRFVRRVERPHGLPRAQRQFLSSAGGRNRYLDNQYKKYGVAVELDGTVAHPADARWQDIHRDNASATVGIITLRYSWADITTRPCQVAREIARVLKSRGWAGDPRPCAPGCRIQTLIVRDLQSQ